MSAVSLPTAMCVMFWLLGVVESSGMLLMLWVMQRMLKGCLVDMLLPKEDGILLISEPGSGGGIFQDWNSV